MRELYIGIMSGTSVDAADAVLVDFSQGNIKLLTQLSLPWPAEIRTKILALAAGCADEIDAFGDLDILIAQHFAALTLKLLETTDFSPQDIRAIGSHGQTIRHRPNATRPHTVQIGDPNTLAEKPASLWLVILGGAIWRRAAKGLRLCLAFIKQFLQTRSKPL